jgi:spermidine synthase
MDLWFSEFHTNNVKFSIKIKEQLFSAQSDYQKIDVFDTFEFGKILTLDGYLMVTEKDEFIYHDMITHIPMAVNPAIKKVLVVDSTDPFGPGEGLFTKEFYGNCYKSLKEDGILVNQHESTFYDNYAKAVKRTHKLITNTFNISRVYQAHIPTYPSGHWLFGFASKKFDPILDLKVEQWNKLNIKTNYYNTDLHLGSFALPNYVIKLLHE